MVVHRHLNIRYDREARVIVYLASADNLVQGKPLRSGCFSPKNPKPRREEGDSIQSIVARARFLLVLVAKRKTVEYPATVQKGLGIVLVQGGRNAVEVDKPDKSLKKGQDVHVRHHLYMSHSGTQTGEEQ